MELLKTVKRRSFWSNITYYAFNIGLAVILLFIAQTINSPYPALALVLLSKWRVVAVRPRFWWANIQANLVDIIVGLGVVGLMYLPATPFIARVALAVFYAVWLVLIKPLSKRWQVALQDLVSVFIGVTALLAISYDWPTIFVVIGMFVIGYASCRHFLHTYEEDHIVQMSLLWGVIFAEFGWLAAHWTFTYRFSFAPNGIPQMTIILILLSFCAGKVYHSWRTNDKVIMSEVVGPIALLGGLSFVMLAFFNSVVI